MACGGCKNGKGTRHVGNTGDLRKFAFLSPRQLRLLEANKQPPVVGGDGVSGTDTGE